MAKNRRYMMDEDFDEKDRIDDNDIDDYYVQEAPVKRSRKSNKNKRSAGIIAAVIVVCVLVAGGIGLVTLIDKYTPNKTKITFEEYYREHGYISEAGASVYSASQIAKEEFPDYHVEERSAVSIAQWGKDGEYCILFWRCVVF